MDEDEFGGFFQDEESDISVKIDDDTVVIPVTAKDACMYCGRVPLVVEIKKTFGINACSSCSRTEMKFVTKTSCMQDYLLPSDDLKQFKYLSRPNPHKGSWNDMQLYIEDQIRSYAFERYGGAEAIEKLKEERKVKKKTRRLESVKKRVRELKRKTFVADVKEKHVHKFVNNGKTSTCSCGAVIEEEEL